jgi:ParB family transcriptional regulator, chromosome partitioning protein
MSDTVSDAVHQIPLDRIDAEAVTRDRTRLDPDALTELTASIARGGLRQPIEVFALDAPEGGPAYGLISGFRRLRAFRDLADLNPARFATIPAFVRRPADVPAILAAMVEENDVRAGLSAWEKGAVAARATAEGWFPDLPTALTALYPGANRHKRARIRAVAELAAEMDGVLQEPERLTERECLRFAATVAAGFGDHIAASLDGALAAGHEAQWAIIEAIIREAEAFPEEHPIRDGRPNRRRITRHRKLATHAVAIRRERTPHGFVLHVTGREATTRVINQVFDEIERWLSPG